MKTKQKFNSNFNTYNLDAIIDQRLKLNTNRRILEYEFNLIDPSLKTIKNTNYLHKNFLNWDQEKRNRFILTLGGRVNFKQTETFINNLVKF